MPFQEKLGFLNIKLLKMLIEYPYLEPLKSRLDAFLFGMILNIATRDKMNFEVVASSKSFRVVKDSLNEAKTSIWE